MSKKTIAYAHGRVQGIRESGWTCGDCGNFYDTAVDHCPNQLLDQAIVDARREETRHAVWKGAPKRAEHADTCRVHNCEGCEEIVDGSAATRDDTDDDPYGKAAVDPTTATHQGAAGDPAADSHLAGCPCENGPCCPWMGNCTCQCMCDFIARIENRVRAERNPRENDAAEDYRTGYATAVAEITSNHGDDATFQLGYKQALLDITAKARAARGATFATVDELMQDLTGEAP